MYLKDKDLFSSLTVIGAAIFAAVEVLEKAEVVPAGVAHSAAEMVQAVAAFLTVVGARRAVGALISK